MYRVIQALFWDFVTCDIFCDLVFVIWSPIYPSKRSFAHKLSNDIRIVWFQHRLIAISTKLKLGQTFPCLAKFLVHLKVFNFFMLSCSFTSYLCDPPLVLKKTKLSLGWSRNCSIDGWAVWLNKVKVRSNLIFHDKTLRFGLIWSIFTYFGMFRAFGLFFDKNKVFCFCPIKNRLPMGQNGTTIELFKRPRDPKQGPSCLRGLSHTVWQGHRPMDPFLSVGQPQH